MANKQILGQDMRYSIRIHTVGRTGNDTHIKKEKVVD